MLRNGRIPEGVSRFQLIDNPELTFVAGDSLVLSQLYWQGEQGWEPDLLPWWRYFCRHSNGVLELGANVGYFTVQGAKAGSQARYSALEPHPKSLAICRANLELNGIRHVDVIHAAAVADPAVASVQLLVPSDQLPIPTVAYMSAGTELPQDMAGDSAKAIEVPAAHVCDLLHGIDLIKLDVEGQEHALLKAAREYLRDRQPTVFVEVLPGTVKLRAFIADLCAQDGYRCYAVTPGRLVELELGRLLRVDLKNEYGNHDLILSAARIPLASTALDR